MISRRSNRARQARDKPAGPQGPYCRMDASSRQPMLTWQPWSLREAVWVLIGIIVGILVLESCVLRLHRVALLRELADQVRAEALPAPDHHPWPFEDPESTPMQRPVNTPRQRPDERRVGTRPRLNLQQPERATASREPEPQPEPNSLWILLLDHGGLLVGFLDSRSPEVLKRREASGGMRMQIASAWARVHRLFCMGRRV